MENSLSRNVPIPIKAAITVAFLTALALAMVIFMMLRIETTTREYSAAQQAEREYVDVAAKLPGLATDPEIAEMGRAALADLALISSETGQERIIAVRGSDGASDNWPDDLDYFADGLARFDADGLSYAGVTKTLGDGGQVLVAYPVRSTGPLTSAFLSWGLAIVLVIVTISALVAWVTGAAISRRIARLNALCDTVEQGEVTARADVSTSDEIGTLAAHMNNMLDELQRRLEALRDTADGLAHDLRTPLARVQGRLSRLEEMVDEEKASAEARLATQDLAQLMEAFNALLELREIETQGAVSMASFKVEQAVENAIELYEAVGEDEHGLTFKRYIEPCQTIGNAQLIVRALANLIDNATKVSSDGGTIEISLVEFADRITISVQDEGPGLTTLPSGHQSTLGGHGIGLRIVRAVARLHGGSFTLIDLDSGARAELNLPRSRGS